MSFGFGPGDIALFTKFAGKIVSSLKENGSRSEFQQAEEQCEAFLSLINETQHLDLSIVPESFRQKIFENSTNMQRLVEKFKKSIGQYETSMGKGSSRGSIRSAPRKVQWALLAAEDLKTFRNGLGSYVQLAQLTIQTSMLAIIGSRSQLPPITASPSHNLLLNDGSVYSTSQVQYSPIVPPFIGGYELFRQVDDLTNIIYKRLLTRPAIQISRRVNTLPDDSIDIIPSMPFDSMQRENLPPSTSHSRERQPTNREESRDIQGTSANHNTQQSLADDIDEYLTSMNLNKLSREEREYVGQNDQSNPRPPLYGAMRQRTRPQIPRLSNVIDSLQPCQDQTSSSNEPSSQYDTNDKASKFLRLDPLSAAASIIGLYALAAEFSLNLSNIFRDTNGKCKEVRLLSQRLGQYSELLQSVCGVVTAMSFSEELRRAGTSILHDNECLTKDLEAILSRYAEIYKYRLIRKLSWNLVKRDVLNMVEQIDFLKSSLSLMLQLYQIKMTESQIQMLRQSH